MNKKLILLILLFLISVCPVNADDKISVFVSIVPQKHFVQQIGKDKVDVKIMVQPGASPATYEPKPWQMAALSKAKFYFSIGVPFENAWLKKISAANPEMEVIHTDHGIEKIAMAEHHHGEDEHHHEKHEAGHHKGAHHEDRHHKEDHHNEDVHKDEHAHGHTGLDPHIWTAPELVKIQAKTIMRALQQAAPQYTNEFQANYNAFAAQIDALDHKLKQTFAGQSGMQFMVFHPAWGYFAKAYGLKQVPIEIEGKNPKPAQLKELIKHAKEKGIKVIFVQPQFSTKSAKVIADEIGGAVAFANPLAEDWMKNLRMIAGKFKSALK